MLALRRKPLPTSDSPEDSLDDMAKCLLSFENKFQWFDDVKYEIEERCGIITGHYWTDDDIRHAWVETQKMVKDYTRNQWAYVITFQEMKSSDDDENDSAKAQSDLTERGQDEQPRGSSQDSSDRPTELLSQRSTEHESRPEEDMSESEKAPDGGFSATGINIPLSELFGREATSEETETVPSAYKLIDGCPSRREIRRKKTYVMSYNEETKNAEWVYEILNEDTLAKKNNVKGQFSEFINVKPYTRGHLAAAANHSWCQEACNDTYLFSNMSPQCTELNNCMMNSLENRCRKSYDERKKRKQKCECVKLKDQICKCNVKIPNIHIYTGPIISDTQSVNDLCKKVPDSFFKVIIEENHDGTVSEPIGYLITNDETTLKYDIVEKLMYVIPMIKFVEIKYKTSVKHIEIVSELKFYVRDVQMVNEEIRTVTWTGEDGRGESCSAKIGVRIRK